MADQIIVQYRINGFGSDDDLARRHRVEELVDDALQASKLGECDGGEIGSGTMNIFLVVSDVGRAQVLLIRMLGDHGELHDAVIAVSAGDDEGEAKVIWPEGYDGRFSIL